MDVWTVWTVNATERHSRKSDPVLKLHCCYHSMEKAALSNMYIHTSEIGTETMLSFLLKTPTHSECVQYYLSLLVASTKSLSRAS